MEKAAAAAAYVGGITFMEARPAYVHPSLISPIFYIHFYLFF